MGWNLTKIYKEGLSQREEMENVYIHFAMSTSSLRRFSAREGFRFLAILKQVGGQSGKTSYLFLREGLTTGVPSPIFLGPTTYLEIGKVFLAFI